MKGAYMDTSFVAVIEVIIILAQANCDEMLAMSCQ